MKLKQIFFLTAIVLVTFASCKKTDPTPVPVPPPGTPTRAELTKDSIFLYAKQLYLWSDALPTYDAFKPRGYTSKSTDLLNYEAELLAIANSAKNPATNIAYEYYANGTDTKYSYISDIANKNPTAYIPNKTSAVDLEGNGNDFGLKISAYGQNEGGVEPFVLYVTAVYQNSPADKAGMVRSHKILKINNQTIGANYTAERDGINTALNATSIKLEGITHVNGIPDAPFTVNLTKAS
ncbi:MAG: PDZ domain-containing protein, partial [Sphingobacteriaceae bacterium]|nr:PDZ domain-containing protein [Sphingobacteriaceae bacterium]